MIRAQADAKALEKTDPKQKKKPGDKGEDKFLPYSYVAHDDVTHEAKAVLTKHGILFSPMLKEMTQEGNRTKAVVDGHFTNVDKPEETLSYLGIGYGCDGADKGPGKAMTYAKKMILQNALLLDSADDIEGDQKVAFEPSSKSEAQRDAEALTEVAVKAWADAYRDALRGCKSKKDLLRVRAENAAMMKKIPEATKDYFVDMIAGLEGTLE